MFQISGKIKLIENTQTFGSGFTKREFVITTADDKYPQDIKFEVVKDKCSQLDQFSKDQAVQVNFDIRGNEYNGRYFVNLNCWKLEALDGSTAKASPKGAAYDHPFGDDDEDEPSADDLRGDDIPF